MSEYRYYEFRAIDRPITDRQKRDHAWQRVDASSRLRRGGGTPRGPARCERTDRTQGSIRAMHRRPTRGAREEAQSAVAAQESQPGIGCLRQPDTCCRDNLPGIRTGCGAANVL